MAKRRVEKLNSLLKEVIVEVLQKDMHHALECAEFLTITSVDISSDLSYAKVFFSLIGEESAKLKMVQDLNAVASQIARRARRKVVLRKFPRLEFFVDEGLDKQLRIFDILADVMPDGSKEST